MDLLLRRPAASVVASVVTGLALLSGCAAAPAAEEPRAPAAPAAVSSGLFLPESEPTRVVIPSLDVDTRLVDLGLRPDRTMEVPATGSVAGWYTSAPTPGELGPAVIAAHVDWKGEAGVFADLKKLDPGDEIAVRRKDGRTALFQVLDVQQYPKDRFPTDAVYGDIQFAGLRLITCGGEFDRKTRSYVDNVVVYAGLVGSY